MLSSRNYGNWETLIASSLFVATLCNFELQIWAQKLFLVLISQTEAVKRPSIIFTFTTTYIKLTAPLRRHTGLKCDRNCRAASARTRPLQTADQWAVELETRVREVFTITEKTPGRAFSLFKAHTSTYKYTLLNRPLNTVSRHKIGTPTQLS